MLGFGREKGDSYRDVFCGGGVDLTKSGRVVLTDLMNHAKFLQEDIKDEESLRFLGRRDSVNRIIGGLNWEPTDIVMSKRGHV